MSEEKKATAGFDFYDLRYSGCALISAVDIPAVIGEVKVDESGKVTNDVTVNIPGKNKVYGPYRLDRVFSRGNGKLVFVGFNANAATNSKPKTKAELEAEAIARDVENERLRKELAELKAATHKK